MIEYSTFMYLRSMSFNKLIEGLSAFYDKKNIIEKETLLIHMEEFSDTLPSCEQVTEYFKPFRSGFYAWDGTWIKLNGENLVILVCFDVFTLDVLGYVIADDETYESYKELINKINKSESDILANAKGFFADGEPSLIKHFKKDYSHVPFQLCVFHKYSRIGQLLPFKRAEGKDLEIKARVEKILFAPTKESALSALKELRDYASEHKQNKKLQEVIGILKRNFEFLLTHYDNPEMSPYNNVLEGFNDTIKRKTNLMKGFKKAENVERWIKLIILDYRFHEIRSSSFKDRNGKSPLELANVSFPEHANWIKMLRKEFRIAT